jgi:hypothetical protein
MPERPTIASDIHALLNEANDLVLSMALRGATTDEKAADLIVRLLACAEQSR